jgi:cytochrome c oxidase subunit I+III
MAANFFAIAFWALLNAARHAAGRTRPGQTLPELLLATYAKGIAVMGMSTAALLLARAWIEV